MYNGWSVSCSNCWFIYKQSILDHCLGIFRKSRTIKISYCKGNPSSFKKDKKLKPVWTGKHSPLSFLKIYINIAFSTVSSVLFVLILAICPIKSQLFRRISKIFAEQIVMLILVSQFSSPIWPIMKFKRTSQSNIQM